MSGSDRKVTAGLVDFHCHLDLYPDHPGAVQEAENAGVFTLAVTTTPRAWPRNHELAQRTRYVRAALGLHPQLVEERFGELNLWDRYLPETRYVGEVGLDAGPRFYKSFDLQKQVFQHVLQRCAEAGARSSRSTASDRLRSYSITSSPICHHYEEKWYSTGLRARNRRLHARSNWDAISR